MKHKLNDGKSPLFFKFRKSECGFSWIHHNSMSVDSLLDLSAKVVAEYLPFEYVEKMLVHIPEPVQEKIIYYSFPRRDSDIYTYASFHPKGDKCRDKIPYYEGLDHFQNGCVEDVVQIGFHLTGSVKQQGLCVSPDTERRKFEVSITFDRCKIISVCCDCGNKGLSWCPHVVALALFRIRQPHLVDYRSPISDALVRMDRSQLQKFAQYLIASHPNKVLPSAQHLADQLLQPESNINKTSGAPDPTAGASVEDVAAWYLDEAGVREQLRTELANLANAGSASSSGPSSINNFTNSVATNPRSSGGRSTPLGITGNTPGMIGQNGSAVGTGTDSRESEADPSSQFTSGATTSHDANTAEVNSSMDHPQLNEIGLHWLLRYRRFLFSQNLFSPTHQANGPCPLSSLDPNALGGNNFGRASTETSSEWFSVQPSSILSSVNGLDLTHSCGSSQGAGAQIGAMFAKVRELLAKRDSNGPRLLSLITEELLRCPKLPLLKARRSHRGVVELSTRIHNSGLARSASAHQLSSPNVNLESPATSISAGPSSSQIPGSTTRLWDEVCVLWTCVVLNPDCSQETRRNWRNRFISWSRTHRCPRDEAYAIPDHFFAQLRDHNELEEDGTSQTTQPSLVGQSQQTPNRSSRRVSVFQLPVEVSFMSWEDDWLRHLLGLDLNKHIKGKTGDLSTDYDSYETTSNSSIDFDDNSSETFRRPSNGTPRRNSNSGRPLSNSSPSSTPPRDCHCPYCDLNAPLNEPFPLLCLRVAALRSNGYVAQAIRLAVFISQRLLRSFKSTVSHASNVGVTRTMQQSVHPYPPPYYPPSPHHLPTDPISRRSPFVPNSSSMRPCGLGPVYAPNRYSPAVKALSPSPMSAHPKYPPSGRLPSPRPSSVSPPVSTPISGRPVSRRRVMSPGANLTPGPSACLNQFTWSGQNSCTALPPPLYKSQPPPPYGVHSQSFTHQSGCHTNANLNTPFYPYQSKHPSHPHSFRSPPMNPHSPYGSGPVYPPGRSLTSPKLSGRTSSSHPSRTSTPPCGSPNNDNQADYFVLLSGNSSTACSSHAESGWIGLPGRPILCLIECLMDAAAMAVEINHCTSAATRPWVQLESASFYLCLSIKVSLLALLQQRRLSGSANRLLACQSQEARLLALLHTIPKDTTTLLAVCEALSYLLGPPTLPRQLNRVDTSPGSPGVSGSLPSWCWWSALGPVIHPDSYPVHAIAHFVLDYILEAQKQTQLTLVNNCWAGFGHTAPSVRLEDLLFAVVTRAMRFSALESVSDNLGLPSTTVNRGNFAHEPTTNVVDRQSHQSRVRTPFPHSYWDSTSHPYELNGDMSTLSTSTPGHALVNDPPGYPNPNMIAPSDHPSADSFHSHVHSNAPRSVHFPTDFDRYPLSQTHYPPLPSAFANAVQACLRLSDSYPHSAQCAPIPPVVPNPVTSSTCFTRTHPTTQHNPEQFPLVVYQQNGNLRRCLETLERQQTQLAISLIRLSKSHMQRLDQTVQICDRHIHSAVSLLAISQQIFAEAVGLDPAIPSTSNYDPVPLFKSNLLTSFANSVCQLGPSSSASSTILPTPTSHYGGVTFTRDRTNLISAAFYLALLVILRTLSRTVHWRRREMLAWSVSTALHVGPSACLYLVTHWSAYVSPREAVNWLAPTLLSVLNKSDSGVAPEDSKSNGKPADQTCIYHPVHCSEPSMCSEHALLFGYVNSDGYASSDLTSPSVAHSSWPPWYGYSQPSFASRGHTNSIAMAAQLLSSAVPYSASARYNISAAVRTMAMQAAAKDPVNCALPALALAERSPAAFDAVYRLVLHSAGTGGLGPVQLFSLARYMDSRGWAWRAFPFALHATRLFVLSTMQDSHPVAGHVLWACSLAHRLGPGPLQELLNHVIRNIHCPTLLTEILYRCRIPPSALCTNAPGVNSANGVPLDVLGPNSVPPRNPPSANFSTPTPYYHLENGKLLSLDRPPLKCLLDAAINAFVTATHTRLSNISPRQYAEFVDFLTRARDTFHLLRPDGPAQFRSLVECLRQTYRGKRKLVSLLAERFG